MEKRIYEQPALMFGGELPVENFGLVKVNSRNYELLKKSSHPQVVYNHALGVLMIDKNLVMIDNELADDIALYQPNFITNPQPKKHLEPPPIRPIEPIRLLDIVL